jgi:hypothetical protein
MFKLPGNQPFTGKISKEIYVEHNPKKHISHYSKVSFQMPAVSITAIVIILSDMNLRSRAALNPSSERAYFVLFLISSILAS